MNLAENIEIKSIQEWERFANEHKGENTDWDTYCKPGDLVNEEVYNYFLDILPPRTMNKVMLQVGEPHSTMKNPETGKYQNTYATFVSFGTFSKYGNLYQYKGNCFVGQTQDMSIYKQYTSIQEFMKETYSLIQKVRPRVICKDGFSFSVQAGLPPFYCIPRNNLKSGRYTACEVGHPNKKEDLLMRYIECSTENPMESVYPYVPVEVIDKIIKNHGGYFVAG